MSCIGEVCREKINTAFQSQIWSRLLSVGSGQGQDTAALLRVWNKTIVDLNYILVTDYAVSPAKIVFTFIQYGLTSLFFTFTFFIPLRYSVNV